MPVNFTEFSVHARYKELPVLMAQIAAWADSMQIAPARMHRLQLLVEELFTNTVKHAHGGECSASIRVGLGQQDEHLHLRYSDEGPAFDTANTAFCRTSDVSIGGLGLGLLHKLSKSLRYARVEGRNVTELLV